MNDKEVINRAMGRIESEIKRAQCQAEIENMALIAKISANAVTWRMLADLSKGDCDE